MLPVWEARKMKILTMFLKLVNLFLLLILFAIKAVAVVFNILIFLFVSARVFKKL